MTFKKFFFVLALVFLASTPVFAKTPEKSLFVSVIQDPPVFSDRAQIHRLVKFSKKSGVKTLFVQVYRANQSWFPSEYADDSPYEESLKAVGEDSFKLLIQEAHRSGIKVHAWFNLLSLSANTNAPMLKKFGPKILTKDSSIKNNLEDYKLDDQYFLEPGDPDVLHELTEIMGEVASHYPNLDGIQFDYIRYPDLHPVYGHTEANMRRFEESTGLHTDDSSAEWKKWKSDRVTELVKTLGQKARSLNPRLQVSTTGLMPYSRASLEAFQDWKKWVNEGLIDFVTLMCYVYDVPAFERYLKDAQNQGLDLKKVNIAVGAYALLENPALFKKEWDICESSGYRGCAALHYGNFEENVRLSDIFSRKKL